MKKLARLLVKLLIVVIIAGASYNYLTITRYAPGDEPDSFFPIVLEVPKSNPPRFELFRWSELKKLLAADPKRTISLPVGERHFTLEPDKNFTPSVKFQVIDNDDPVEEKEPPAFLSSCSPAEHRILL